MVRPFGLEVSYGKFPKAWILEDLTKGGKGLGEDFLPVGHKKKTGFLVSIFGKASVIKSCNGGFSCTRSGNNEIARAVMDLPLSLQGIKDLFLIRVGTDSESIGKGGTFLFAPSPFSINGVFKMRTVFFAKVLKFITMPVCIKGRMDFFHDKGHILLGDLHIPFKSIGDGCMGEI